MPHICSRFGNKPQRSRAKPVSTISKSAGNCKHPLDTASTVFYPKGDCPKKGSPSMRRLLVLTCVLFCLLAPTVYQAKEQDIPKGEPPSAAQPAPQAPSGTSRPQAAAAEPLPHGANGDGLLQTSGFPLPCGARSPAPGPAGAAEGLPGLSFPCPAPAGLT